MTTTAASGRCETSPVSSPTASAPYTSASSAYFWLDSALSGVV